MKIGLDIATDMRSDSWRNVEQFRHLIQSVPAALYACDREGRITLYNQAAVDLWGREPAVGKEMWCGSFRIYDIKGTSIPLEECPMAITLKEGRPIRGVEIIVEREDGSRRIVLPHPTPLFDDDGELIGALNMLVDITDRKGMEEALVQADRRKDEFLAMLAHELRNPLAPIRTAASILRSKGSEDPAIQTAYEIIERQVQNMSRLLDDLLDVSRITRGKALLKQEHLDLATSVSAAIEVCRPIIVERRHRLRLDSSDERLQVYGDRLRIEQVIVNILNNAAKYTPPGGQITLRTERRDNEAIVRIEDNGQGISAELLPHVFDLFIQDERNVDRSNGGLGIGLTMARSLVEMHGGRIVAESLGPNRGSCFTVALPLSGESQSNGRPSNGSFPTEAPVSTARILVVDDNQDGANALSELIRIWGHDALAVHDGPSALAAIHTFRPQAILLDIGMPGMDGFEVARRIQAEHGPAAPTLIAMTGYGREEDRERSRAAGFAQHLTKPVDPPVLESMIKKLAVMTR